MQVGTRSERDQDRRSKAGSALARRLVADAVRSYQLVLSPWLGPACRFEPSCSRYAIAAIERHGVLRGGFFSLRRLARCHPLGGSGFDPIP